MSGLAVLRTEYFLESSLHAGQAKNRRFCRGSTASRAEVFRFLVLAGAGWD
jgi:hypothetical protein